MNKKRVFILINLVLFFTCMWFIWIYGGIHYSYVDSTPELNEYGYIDLYQDEPVNCRFSPESHYLEGVSIILAGLTEGTCGTVEVSLQQEDGEVLAKIEKDLSSIRNGEWEVYDLRQRLSTSKSYIVNVLLKESDISPIIITKDDSIAMGVRYAKEASNLEKLTLTSFCLFLIGVALWLTMGNIRIPTPVQSCVVVFLMGVLFVFYLPNISYKIPYINLDDSWRYFLNIAGHEGYVFGKDVFFTYGPLGYLCYMMNLPGNGSWFVAGVVIWIAIIIIYAYLLIKLFALFKKGGVSLLSIISSTLLAIGSYIVLERDNFLLYLLVISTSVYKLDNREKRRDNIPAYVISCVLLTLMFFAKFSTFTSGFAFLTLFVLYEGIILKNWGGSLLIAPSLLTMPVCYLIYNPSLSNLKDYVVGIVKISSGWMETQQFDFTVTGVDLIALIAIVVCFIIILAIMLCTQYENASAIFACSASMFFVYKYATTRHGLNCGIWLFGMLYSAMPLTIDFKRFKGTGKVKFALGILVAACISLTGAFQANAIHNSFGNLRETFAEKAYNWTHLDQLGIEETLKTDQESEVSNSILELIGNETVCVYPWRTAMRSRYPDMNIVYYPSVQNVNEFIPWIDEKTAEWFDSAKAPEFILLKDETIDGHIKYLDNPLTWQRIQKNYELAYFDEKWCVLEQKNIITPPKELSLIEEESFAPGETINVPAGAEYVKIYTEYDTWGKIKKFFYHVYGLNMRIVYDDGTEIIGKIMTPNLASGFELCEYPQNGDEFVMYMSEKNHKRIVQLALCGLGAKDLENNARVEWYSYK